MSRMKGKKTQNTHTGTTKASTINRIYCCYNIFRLLIGIPDYSSSESYGEKQKLILVGFIVISRKTRTHLVLSIPRLWGKKSFRDNKSKYYNDISTCTDVQYI